MSLYEAIKDIGTSEVWVYDWFMDHYGFFIEAQLKRNWTGLTTEQQETTIRTYRNQLIGVIEAMSVQLYWICMVSPYLKLYQNKDSEPPPPPNTQEPPPPRSQGAQN